MSKKLLSIRATITRKGRQPVALEIDVDRPDDATPRAFAQAIDDAFAKVRQAVEEELL